MDSERKAWPNGMPGGRSDCAQDESRHGARHRALHRDERRSNPLHYDKRRLRATPFGCIVVAGRCDERHPEVGRRGRIAGPGTVFMQVNWGFKAPVRPGDTITGEVDGAEGRHRQADHRTPDAGPARRRTVVLDGNAVCYTMPIG